MTHTAAALYSFFSGFGLPAYPEYIVPDDAQLPYITYQLQETDWRANTTIYARVWYRSTSLTEISAKVDEIAAAVGEGLSIPTPNGCVMLTRGTPFMQYMPMEGDDTLRVMYLLFDLYTYTD
mgnify:CR=1 FL=1